MYLVQHNKDNLSVGIPKLTSGISLSVGFRTAKRTSQSRPNGIMAPPPARGALAIVLFAMYLGVNLGALLLAAESQRQPRRYLNSTAVTLSELIKFASSILAIYAGANSSGVAVQATILDPRSGPRPTGNPRHHTRHESHAP